MRVVESGRREGLLTMVGCGGLPHRKMRIQKAHVSKFNAKRKYQPSNQPGARQPNDQNRLGVAQTNQDTSLERDPHPGWGPVNFLGGRL